MDLQTHVALQICIFWSNGTYFTTKYSLDKTGEENQCENLTGGFEIYGFLLHFYVFFLFMFNCINKTSKQNKKM